MNEQALIDELKKPEYQGLSDQQAADAIAALAVQTVRWVDAEGIGECGIGYVFNARRAIAGGA